MSALKWFPHVELENKANSVAQQEGSEPGAGNPKSVQGSGHSRQWGCTHCLLHLGIWLYLPPLTGKCFLASHPWNVSCQLLWSAQRPSKGSGCPHGCPHGARVNSEKGALL